MKEEKRHINWEQQWLEGNINATEARKHATNTDSIEQIDLLLKGYKDLEIPRVMSKSEAWNIIESKISSPSPKVVSISRRKWIARVAASFILALGAFFLFKLLNSPNTTISTQMAEVKGVPLPDGSIAFLNASSTLSFENDWSEERLIELKGEAFFEVKKGSTFRVNTSYGNVEVLGTSFNVRARNGRLTVVCKTGKVKVSNTAGSESKVIYPDQLITVKNGAINEPLAVNGQRADIWRRNEFDYEKMPVKEVFSEFERIFDVTVQHNLNENELNSTTSGTFSTKAIEDAILTIELTMGYQATFENDGKVVRFSDK